MPPQRKSKDVTGSPSRQPASRKRSSRTSKTSPATDGDESDDRSARPSKRPRGASSRIAKQDDDDDGLGNYGRSSRPTTIEQHLMDLNKKSKEFILDFKEQVAQGRAQAQATLSMFGQDLAKPPDAANGNLVDIFATMQTAAQGTLSMRNNPLFQQTQQLLRLSHAILDCHRTVERDSPKQELVSLREMWKQDEEGMRKLLGYGKMFGEKVVEGWITPHSENDGEEDGESDGKNGDGESEAENLAKGLFKWKSNGLFPEGETKGSFSEWEKKPDGVFERERKAEGVYERERKSEGVYQWERKEWGVPNGEDSWGVAARKQMVALAGVVRTLPSKASKEE